MFFQMLFIYFFKTEKEVYIILSNHIRPGWLLAWEMSRDLRVCLLCEQSPPPRATKSRAKPIGFLDFSRKIVGFCYGPPQIFVIFSNTLRRRPGKFVYQNRPKIVFIIKLVLTKYKQGSCRSESSEKVYSSPETSDRAPGIQKIQILQSFR